MFLYYLIAVLSVILYLHGFFPIPARTLQDPDDRNFNQIKPTFKRAVVIVIDALRLDFAIPNLTPFISKTSQSNGCFIKLKVETPTVTLPRIKALTTGQVPQFVDIIFNLASPTKLDDSFVHQARLSGKNVIFYGDDTWLKLFPGYFKRSEGTTSFYVTDFTEVDDNVTRNVKEELHRTDWDIMILHYLGLDHIGHVLGPKCSLMTNKLEEMDNIIEEIYNHLNETLIFVTSDHGMRDSGGHGGSTFSETNVPLIVLGMPCRNDTFSQIDIPAHLAILLGFKIPLTSIGQLHLSLLTHLSLTEYLEAQKYNVLLLSKKMRICEDDVDKAKHLHDLYLLNKSEILGREAANLYENCSQILSKELLKASVHQNMVSLFISIVMILSVILKILPKLCNGHVKIYRWEQVGMFCILILQFSDLGFLVSLLLSFASFIIIMFNIINFDLGRFCKFTDYNFLLCMLILHPFSFLSSSYLEEEHEFWYYFGSTFILINLIDTTNLRSWFCAFVVLRFLRTINQVGDKWASHPDLADWLLKSDNYLYLQLLFITSLILTFNCNLTFTRSKFNVVINGLILLFIYIFKTLLNESVSLGQVLWLLIFIKFVYCIFQRESLISVWALIISLLLKPYNVILIPMCMLASQHFHAKLRIENLVLSHWWMGNLLFFAQGHDNSLASVDISAGYVGLSNYDPIFVFPQVLCHTYAFPVLSHLLLFKNSFDSERYLSLFFMFRLYVIVIVFIVTLIHRHHLFIWSVFAPKIFIEATHLASVFIEVCCIFVLRGCL